MTLMVRVPLAMFGQAMFSDRFALFLAALVLTKVVIYAGVGTIDCYGACDFRSARVGCPIFTLLVSVLCINLRAFRRRDQEGVREASTNVESASRNTKRCAEWGKYDQLSMTRGRAR